MIGNPLAWVSAMVVAWSIVGIRITKLTFSLLVVMVLLGRPV